MKIEVIKPKNDVLKKYIDCFYILTHSKSDIKTTYFTFPNMFSIVSITSNAKITKTINKIGISSSLKENFISDLETSFSEPLLIQYKGDIKEITTYFKPLGLNAFLDNSISFYNTKQCSNFIPFKDYKKTMSSILKLKSNKKTIEKLEDYWTNKYTGFHHLSLQQSIENIIENPNLSIAIIAQNNNLSHKTLISHFKKHIGKTPSEFRKVVRFRKALYKKENNNLTEISYLANYFDQAHMIKDFKKLTGYKPKMFFKNLSSIDKNVNWIFI